MEIRIDQTTDRNVRDGLTGREMAALQRLMLTGSLAAGTQGWLGRFDFSKEMEDRRNITATYRGDEMRERFNDNLIRVRMKAGTILEMYRKIPMGKTLTELQMEGWKKEYLERVKADMNKGRITEISIFSLQEGGYAIRCKVDGEQQLAEKLSREDAMTLNDRTNKETLAEKYFADALYMGKGENKGIKR